MNTRTNSNISSIEPTSWATRAWSRVVGASPHNDYTFAAADDLVWRQRALWLIAALLLFRIAYAALVPLNLVPDEAYYWEWSRRLDYGYYSKPPMVAWLIALSTSVLGNNEFGVRLPAVLLGTLSLVFLYAIAARMFNPRVGFMALLLIAAAPGSAAIGLLMTIDAPLMFFWGVALYCVWRLFERRGARWPWLVGATLATGLGLLSKQTMVGIIPLTGLFLLLSRDDRGELRRPWFWAWALVSLAFVLPVLYWNAQHDWITAEHTSGHFATQSVPLLKRLSRVAELIGALFGVLSPLTCLLCITVMIGAALSMRRLARRELFLVCFCVFPLTAVLMLSFFRRVEANWPAPFFPAAVVLVSAWIDGRLGELRLPPTSYRTFVRAATLGSVMVIATYLLPLGLPWVGLAGTRIDPVLRLRGWRQLGETVAPQLAHARGEKPIVMVASGRAAASELAFYLPDQPKVYLWPQSGPVVSQYQVWGGPQGKDGCDALIVTAGDAAPPPELADNFESFTDKGTVLVPIGPRARHHFRLWHAHGYRGDAHARVAERTAAQQR